MRKINEECGIIGIFGQKRQNVAQMTYYGLHALQHRGQEGCGIAVNDDGVYKLHKNTGLVTEVFDVRTLESLGEGNIAVGHARYGTAGSKGAVNCQPIVVNHVKGNLCVALNGTLVNYAELRSELELEGAMFHTTSDAEIIAYVITRERIKSKSIEEAVNRAMGLLEGAFSLVIATSTKVLAVRDKFGFRPLCYGVTEDGDYIVASETCALDVLGAKFIADVTPGEIVLFNKQGDQNIKDNCGKVQECPCIFEYVYFARPDSVVDGSSVHEARKRAGRFLAMEHKVEADVVIGCPDSGIDGAIGYAEQSGIPYGLGFLKNKYIGRTFIQPEQGMREKAVRMKLNVIKETVAGKRVVLIDDSIVRGTTSVYVVKLLREAGAKEVHMRVTSPKFIGACYYGTDIDSPDKLIANKHTTEEIAEIIGVDSLGFLSIDSVKKIPSNYACHNYCISCFTAEYPTKKPDLQGKSKFESKITKNV